MGVLFRRPELRGHLSVPHGQKCNQQLEDCGFPFTFPGNYCEDQSDGCGDPGGGPDPDVDDGGTGTCECPTSAHCR